MWINVTTCCPWRSISLFSCLLYLIRQWYCAEKLETGHYSINAWFQFQRTWRAQFVQFSTLSNNGKEKHACGLYQGPMRKLIWNFLRTRGKIHSAVRKMQRNSVNFSLLAASVSVRILPTFSLYSTKFWDIFVDVWNIWARLFESPLMPVLD